MEKYVILVSDTILIWKKEESESVDRRMANGYILTIENVYRKNGEKVRIIDK